MTCTTSPLHSLLLLSDSALPLGSFAFSSGLESFLAHNKHQLASQRTQAFHQFLDQSVLNTASTALPYVLAGYLRTHSLDDLDNDFDASTPCTVARRASITQGKALLAVWERALHAAALSYHDEPADANLTQHNNDSIADEDVTCGTPSDVQISNGETAREVSQFAALLKMSPGKASTDDIFALKGHLAPLFGAVSRALGLTIEDTAYVFLLNHSKAVLSAAVRASVFGPYQSQAVLASASLQKHIRACINEFRYLTVEDAMVTVPPMDLWMGRHELLYSRIFNS